MNGYDFDHTIYAGDSTIDFYFYLMKKYPFLLRYFPQQMMGACLYSMGKISKTEYKEYFFSFLKGVKGVKEEVRAFWNTHEKKIYTWYLRQKRSDDVIISASPEFLLQEIAGRLGINVLIASHVDPESGRFKGENCHGMEKRTRFQAAFPGRSLEQFYSDSRSDLPIARLAQRAYLVKKRHRQEWKIRG